jgi:acetylornithine deacetylase
MLDLVATLSQLVAIPSANSMGRPGAGTPTCEAGVTDFLERTFRELGLPCERQAVEPNRSNILARFDGEPAGSHGGEVILWEVHQDTVPVDGMTIPPWTPKIEGKRLYGRGACDVKGGMAAMLHALSRLIAERPPRRPTIVMAATVNEEYGFSGAKALVRHWHGASRLLASPPSAVIVAEPTELSVVVAHKGAVRWRLHTRGRAAHSSCPSQGDNAIFRMARVLVALERYQREVAPRLGEHPRCGAPTLSIGTIQGGISVNTVPDECVIEVDRRLIPGEDPQAAYRAIVEFVANATNGDPQVVHEPPFLSGPGLSDERNGMFAERLLATARSVRPQAALVGVPYGTNAAVISASGTPTVVFGPGSIDQAHTADEWIDLDQLSAASDVLFRFATG